LFPARVAETAPERPAVIMHGAGTRLTFAELAARSDAFARHLRAAGVGAGDHVALLMENRAEYFEVVWAAQQSALYLTPVNTHLTAEEIAYIVGDCGARAVITSDRLASLVTDVELLINVDDASYEKALGAAVDLAPVPPEEGAWMFYSSGTTGRPKGIRPPGAVGAPLGTPQPFLAYLRDGYGIGPSSRYLCPAPLYHAAPLGWSTMSQRLGASVVVLERFDPLETLAAIQAHRITHAQFVPTHFVRLLKLTDEERSRYDLSSLQAVIHAAAPCPPEVKERMIDWLGPIIHEFYAGSEGVGQTFISSQEWLAHRGSVGRATGCDIHVVDESGRDMPTGEIGMIYFAGGRPFEYHNDPVKTAAAHNEQGWGTLGDYGWLDADGYLYVADRRADLIISGGVNIYPREIEDVIINHPDVLDVAVIGAADEEMGQRVVAYVQPRQPSTSSTLASEVDAWCRAHLAGFKCPRAIEVVEALPRTPDGKLRRRLLGAGPTT
jgi:acyl-CoA synthetase (AMP-forming)/AMP-acid ligase II